MADMELLPTSLEIMFEPAELSADFDSMREKLAEFMEPYRDMDDTALEGMSRKELADSRAAINKLINSVKDGERTVKRDYMKSYDAFHTHVTALLKPAQEAADQLKRHIDRKDEIKREGYRERLNSYYNEIADALAGYVTFDRIYDPDWVKSDAKYKAAFDIISDKCKRLADDWAALRKMQDTLYDFNAAERMLFDTFDLRATIEADERARQSDEERKAMKADLGMETVEEPKQAEVPQAPEMPQEEQYRKRYRFEVWLSGPELFALKAWKNVNCIGMGWTFKEVE